MHGKPERTAQPHSAQHAHRIVHKGIRVGMPDDVLAQIPISARRIQELPQPT